MFAIPALLENGLLTYSEKFFHRPSGYYPLETIFLLLALMALARIDSLEGLRFVTPGEWGKLLGLDRIPEVKTLRNKVQELCSESGRAQRWSRELAQEWMQTQPESAGILYVDGHVRVYHGKQTPLPRRYVAREKLCLRGTTDYWVNAMDGQPFFVVTRTVDPGIITVIRQEILPELEEQVPNQPSEQELAQDRLLTRFTIVFDREAYSPDFFDELWQKRIGFISYKKYVTEQWPESEFSAHEVILAHGEKVLYRLAERGIRLSNGFWVREVRRLSENGHQTAVIGSLYRIPMAELAADMFARWCQENFFKYMREHFNLDGLVEYGTEPLPDTSSVVNPDWRKLDNQIRSENGQLTRQQAQFGALSLSGNPKPEEVEAFEQRKGQLQEDISNRKEKIQQLKDQKKATPKHIELKDLPEEEQFQRLCFEQKHFVDTIKLISYRAETAMASIAREEMAREDDARSLLRQLYQTEVDLLPDHQNQTLTVRLHHLTTHAHDQVIEHLCRELNETKTLFPGTDLRLIFQLGGSF